MGYIGIPFEPNGTSIPETCKAYRHTAAAQLAGNMHDEAATSRFESDLAFFWGVITIIVVLLKIVLVTATIMICILSLQARKSAMAALRAWLRASKEEQGGHENKKHVYCFIQLPTAKSSNHPAKRHRRL